MPLLLRMTLFSLTKLASLLSHTPKTSLSLSNSFSGLGLNIHGISKQDPLSASIVFGAVMKRPEPSGQAAKAPGNKISDGQNVLNNLQVKKEIFKCT